MIIDAILDRKDFEKEYEADLYCAHDFYSYAMGESSVFNGIGDAITRAMDFGTNEDVQDALCDYIMEQGYNKTLCDFVRRKDWLHDGEYKIDKQTCRIVKTARNTI